MDKPNHKLQDELEKLLAQIVHWKREATAYRYLNVTLFVCFKLLIPLGALAVATSAFADVLSKPILDPLVELIVAGVVVLLTGLDSTLNPSGRKRMAFQNVNALRELENRLSINAVDAASADLQQLILATNTELKKLLDEYAERGY